MTTPTASGPLDAARLVVDAAARYTAKGDYWISQVTQALGDLGNIQVDPLTFNIDYDVAAVLPQFVRPTPPVAPALPVINVTVPSPPNLTSVALRALGDAPPEPDFSSLQQYAPPAPPTAPAPTAPANVDVVLDTVVVPDMPVFPMPVRPALFDIVLPTFQPVVLPAFDGVRPTFNLSLPQDGSLGFAEIAYLPTIQAEMKTALQTMIQGGTGLPVAIEQSIFDRGRAREDRLSRKQIQEVDEDMAARGLTEPNGIHAMRLQQAREANRDATHGLNRDLSISTAQMAVEGMKFAVTQGMALEAMLIQQNNALNERALRIAIEAREYGIARLNALISYQNLQQQAYATDTTVWRERITGALAVLDQYKAEIDGQRLIGEINKDKIMAYESEFRGLRELAMFYKAEVEGTKIKADINLARIEAAKLTLDRFSTEVTGWIGLQTGYRAQVEGALGTVQYAEALAQVFNTRMNGYKTKGDAYFNEGRFGIESNTQKLEAFRAQLAGSDQQLRSQIASLDGTLRVFSEETALYSAEGSVAQAESAALDRTTSLRIENERQRVSTFLESMKTRIDQAMKIGEIMVEQLKAKAAALAQLTASSQSAVNYSAGIHEQFNQGIDHSIRYDYTGHVVNDADPGF